MTAFYDETDRRRLACRRCGLKVSIGFIHTLFHESVKGVALCFCGGIEWDIVHVSDATAGSI